VTDDRQLDGLVTEYLEKRITRRTFMKRAAAMGIMASSAAAILAACASSTPTSAPSSAPPTGPAGPTPTTGPKTGGTFIEGYDRDFSPITTVNAAWIDPTHEALLEPLIRSDPAGKLTPVLAESWKSNADVTEWRLKLRSGLKFNSGAACDVAAMVDTLKVVSGPHGQHPYWWAQVTDIKADGDEIVITCSKPYFNLLESVIRQEFSNAYLVATAVSAGKDYGVTVVDGTGPFTLTEFQPGSHVSAKRWDGYAGLPDGAWFSNKGKAYLDGVKWVPLLEAANRANELISGNVHAMKRPLPSDLDALKANAGVVVIESEESAGLTFGLNFARTEFGFDDLRVRQAISQAIDRKAIVDTVLLGHGSPAYGPFPTKYKWYDKGVEKFNQFDTTKAAQLLDDAGWALGSDGIRAKNGQRLSFTITNFTEAVHNQTGDAVVGMLAKVGIEAKMNNLEGGAFFDQLGKPENQAFFFQWLWMSPPNLLQVITGSNFRPAPNWEQANVPEVDAAIDKWQFAASEADAEAAARAIQLVIAEKLPTLTIWIPNVVWAHSTKVHGWLPTDTNLYPYYNDVWLDS
jgi:peptide/nickel transport system substrate-binding protein